VSNQSEVLKKILPMYQ